eukprot:gnl/TRDRNA2_/TRDRNA2_133963_c0_seq1.p1 gnl/TRDRNA2_/TRDRNA2_133963_c0~~gnl/TRDRNA2_/TRDRNA2_133963_c0_seq1.p1  ORF type:complete len:341 (+),score=46.14 gnl/TRDRNA2_/TRDRNA2_133963_c0_seq1:75-1097(+)
MTSSMPLPIRQVQGSFALQQPQRSFSHTAPSRPASAGPEAIVPGDVLYIPSQGRLGQVGTAGGFMGHVVLIIGTPQLLGQDDPTYQTLVAHRWPDGRNAPAAAWLVPTMECTSSKDGLYETSMLLAADHRNGRLMLVAELSREHEMGVGDNMEYVEIWTSPAELRAQVRHDLVAHVRNEMHAHTVGNWSPTTAFRAVFMTANLFSNSVKQPSSLLEEIKDCWEAEPICTSVIVIFWQRFLCRLAAETSQHAAHLIMRWMPTKADRALPGDLLHTMRACGWKMVNSIQGVRTLPFSPPTTHSPMAHSGELPRAAHSFLMSQTCAEGDVHHSQMMRSPVRVH